MVFIFTGFVNFSSFEFCIYPVSPALFLFSSSCSSSFLTRSRYPPPSPPSPHFTTNAHASLSSSFSFSQDHLEPHLRGDVLLVPRAGRGQVGGRNPEEDQERPRHRRHGLLDGVDPGSHRQLQVRSHVAAAAVHQHHPGMLSRARGRVGCWSVSVIVLCGLWSGCVSVIIYSLVD